MSIRKQPAHLLYVALLGLQAAFLSLWFSALDTCTSYFTDWLGIMPLQVSTTAAVVRIVLVPTEGCYRYVYSVQALFLSGGTESATLCWDHAEGADT